jgi:N,N'-diacetyllegionaminate synthase
MAAEKVKDLVARWKVGSGNTTDEVLLKFLGETKKPVIISTGMSTQKEIAKAIDLIGVQNAKALYCRSIYPCPLSKINFNLMKSFDGFSDHTVEITTPMWATLMGAKIIEKHFTLNKQAFGPDHSFSLNPEELKICIKLVRDYEDAMNPVIVPDEEEIKLLKVFRNV